MAFPTDFANFVAWSITNTNSPATFLGVPGASDTVFFNAAGVTGNQTILLHLTKLTAVPAPVAGVLFNAPLSVTISPGLNTGGLAIGARGITVNNAASITMTNPEILTANQFWSVAGSR